VTERENTFCAKSSSILAGLSNGEVSAYEAEWGLLDLGWCSSAIASVLKDYSRGEEGGPVD